MKTAILVLSQSGLQLARRLRDARPEHTHIIGPACVVGRCDVGREGLGLTFPTDEPGVFGWAGPLRKVFPVFWGEFDAIVCVMALGIVVRLAGPLATDKRRDPAIVVVDDAGQFAISVLGGHGAGANELANHVAQVLGATPVITTASEAHALPAVDQIGREFGWTIDRSENLTRVAAAIVRGETIAVWQDAGEPNWWQSFGEWPEHFVKLRDLSELAELQPSAVLVISDRVVTDQHLPADRTVIYRPKTLAVGIGCKRGTSRETIEAWFEAVFAAKGLSTQSLAAVATVTLKADEPGLIGFAEARKLTLMAFRPDELDGQPGIETPSDQVRAKIGIAAVSEPAALLAAGVKTLLVAKQVGPGVTIAVAREEERGIIRRSIRTNADQAKKDGGELTADDADERR
jgi:cobalt-precorrin 5A hydrolase